MLPLSGIIAQPLITTVEVRGRGEIPPASRVVGAVWAGSDQLDAACPCDPGTQLEVHMRGKRVVALPEGPLDLRSLDAEERALLGRFMPWVNEPAPVADGPPAVVEEPPPDTDEVVDEVAEQFDLDPEDAAFLKELLDE